MSEKRLYTVNCSFQVHVAAANALEAEAYAEQRYLHLGPMADASRSERVLEGWEDQQPEGVTEDDLRTCMQWLIQQELSR